MTLRPISSGTVTRNAVVKNSFSWELTKEYFNACTLVSIITELIIVDFKDSEKIFDGLDMRLVDVVPVSTKLRLHRLAFVCEYAKWGVVNILIISMYVQMSCTRERYVLMVILSS